MQSRSDFFESNKLFAVTAANYWVRTGLLFPGVLDGIVLVHAIGFHCIAITLNIWCYNDTLSINKISNYQVKISNFPQKPHLTITGYVPSQLWSSNPIQRWFITEYMCHLMKWTVKLFHSIQQWFPETKILQQPVTKINSVVFFGGRLWQTVSLCGKRAQEKHKQTNKIKLNMT